MASLLCRFLRTNSRCIRSSLIRVNKRPPPPLTIRAVHRLLQKSPVHLHCHRCKLHTSSRCLGEVVAFKLSDVGEGINEVIVKEWFIKEGDQVNQFDNICEVQSDKASVTITSRYDGIVRRIYYQVDDIAKVGLPLVDIEVEDSSESESEADTVDVVDPYEAIPDETGAFAPSDKNKYLATPAVRRIITEHNCDLSKIQGTGKDGRILKEDVLAYLENQKEAKAGIAPPPAAKPPPTAATIAVVKPRPQKPQKVEPIKGIKKVMVQTMTKALTIPHFNYCDEVNCSQLVALRSQLKDIAKDSGVALSYMPFFIKAASLSLEHYPVLGATVDEDCQNLHYSESHNIGVAMDTPQGLLVPCIKGVESMTLLEVAQELNRLQQKGMEGKLSADDLKGATLTLSNIGAIGGTYMKPVILPPSIAIVALGKIQTLPRYDSSGSIVPARVMNISWSADHRVVDGATVARYSNLWKSYVESPGSMLLHLK